MVAGIDDWLFRLADNRECEPSENECKGCKNVTCDYWSDYNNESED